MRVQGPLAPGGVQGQSPCGIVKRGSHANRSSHLFAWAATLAGAVPP